MRSALLLLAVVSAVAAGCEDGPEQVFEPFEGDPSPQNGLRPTDPFTQTSDAGVPIRDPACNPSELGEARFCCEQDHERVVQWMVQQPIIPDQSLGGVPLWSPEGPPTHADTLPGPISAGKLCDPDVYANALVWGPTNEIIAFINQDTRLIELIAATSQYLGTMEGTFVRQDAPDEPIAVRIALRERILLGGRELDQYAGTAEQANATNSWLNHQNVTDLYRFVRQTYFDDAPGEHPADYNCVTDNKCNLIYAGQQSGPQTTLIYMVDSGFILQITPEGHVEAVLIEPVLVAPFQEAPIAMGEGGGEGEPGRLAPTLDGQHCDLDFTQPITWGDVVDGCLGEDRERALKRFTYDVSSQRDAVSVDFNGLTLSFLHDIAERGVLEDGERPDDADVLYDVTITRQLNAPIAEFRPKHLAQRFKEKLEQRLREAVRLDAVGGGEPEADGGVPAEPDAGAPAEPDAGMDAGVGEPDAAPDAGEDPGPPAPTHPFLTWELRVPSSIPEGPQPMDQINYFVRGEERDWLAKVVADIDELYRSLTPEQRAQVDPKVIEPTWILEPFVEVVLEECTHGRVHDDTAWTAFRNTDDKKWVIGFAHFIQDGRPYRVVAQYSLNYGALTAVSVGFGFSPIDELFHAWNDALRPEPILGNAKSPYYSIDLGRQSPTENPFALGGDGIRVEGYDRRLSMLTVELAALAEDGTRTLRTFTVPGVPASDRGGYLRQLRGERHEFVPATAVQLNGKETALLFYVDEADQRIGKIVEGNFKGALTLCDGLTITYGDDVRRRIEEWSAQAGLDAYRQCELVFNYSPNGNVLDEVASLANRVAFTVANGRAITATIWR